MTYEDMIDSDQGSYFEQLEMELRYKNRVKFNKWDGKPKKCKCGNPIEHERLKLLNAITCRKCAFGLDGEEEEETYE